MVTDLETKAGFEKISDVLKDYIEPSQIALIKPETPLIDFGLEDVDILNILHDMGINTNPFILDYERRVLHSTDVFSRIAAFERARGNSIQSQHLRNLGQYDYAPDLLSSNKGGMIVRYLVSISDYALSCPTA